MPALPVLFHHSHWLSDLVGLTASEYQFHGSSGCIFSFSYVFTITLVLLA